MSDQIDLYIPGFLFATLLNKASKSTGLDDGLLFGNIDTQIICAISDTQQQGTMQKKEITIHELEVNSKENNFYNNIGALNEKNISTVISQKHKNIIGWFSIRRNTNASFSLKERTIINNLLHSSCVSANKLVFLLFTPTYEANKATYNFTYKTYLCQKDCTPVSQKLNVINLGAGGEQHTYLHKSRLLGTKSEPSASFMTELQDTQAHKFVTQTGSVSIVDNTHSLFAKVLKCMNKVHSDLSQTNKDVETLQQECKSLEELLANNTE